MRYISIKCWIPPSCIQCLLCKKRLHISNAKKATAVLNVVAVHLQNVVFCLVVKKSQTSPGNRTRETRFTEAKLKFPLN